LPSSLPSRVLLVDDERVIADTLSIIFSNAGYETKVVYSAEDALALMPTWTPDVAILDVVLPKMTGVDLAIRLKAEYPGTKVLLFSGHGATGDILERARDDGHAFECLGKPVHPSILLSLLGDLASGVDTGTNNAAIG
jgi:CheY-like chemotaxis protein